MCVKCDRELEWLNTPEYFCLHCGRHLPGATKNEYCAECVKNGFVNKENREMGMHRKSKESCGECGGRLTRRGYCYRCKEWPGRQNGTNKITEPCAADTIHARPAPGKNDEPMPLVTIADMQAAIELKMAYNSKRPYRHGGKKL